MENQNLITANQKFKNIRNSGFNIYNPIEVGNSNFWYTSDELTALLENKLKGISFFGLPIRTRSKVAKELVCEALGYPMPKSFKKCQPRFVGQYFDIYVQKSNNLQVWNEDLDVERRYVIIRTDDSDIITSIKVISGSDLAKLDTTGTLTQKYQASLKATDSLYELISEGDTSNLSSIISKHDLDLRSHSPVAPPMNNHLLSIKECFNRLKLLVGKTFADAGADQERNRGAGLHALVCEALGYSVFRDDGKFPDVKHQLLEVKLQTSPTIDLGLVCPDSESHLDLEKVNGLQIRHCDVRYALFNANIVNGEILITNVYLTTGKDFFKRFKQFEGKVLNKKIQIPLPKNFFNS